MAKYISGKVKDLNVGISNYSENKTSVTVIGNVGIGTLVPTDQVGSGNTAVLAAGIVSAYQFYGDGSNITGVGATDKIVTESLDVLGISTLRGTLSVAGISTFNDSVRFPDDKKLHFGNIGGAFGDLQIWHDAGQHSYIRDQGSGDLRIYGSAVDIRDNAGTSSVARFSDDGVAVTGNLNVAGVSTFSSLVGISGSLTNINVTGVGTFAELYVSGVSTFAGDINANGNIVGDNSTDITGISSVFATKFYGDGSNLTNLPGIDTSGGSVFTDLFVSGITTLGGTLSVAGVTTLGGNIFLGDSGADNINVNGNFISGLNPFGYGQYDLGTPGQYWRNLYLSDRVEANVGILTHLEISGVSTFSGDVSIGGTLTYEDVTNIDSIGIITAREGIRIGAGKSIGSDGSAAVYYGDGSNLSGVGFLPDSQENLYAGTGTGTDSDADTCYNIGIGYSAGHTNCAGDSNVFIGCYAGNKLESGSDNILIGKNAGCSVTTGQRNIILGCGGKTLTTGPNNILIGAGIGQEGTMGNTNDTVAIGHFAGCCLTGGHYNLLLGSFAGRKTQSGCRNIFLGHYVATNHTTGHFNIALGTCMDMLSATDSHQLLIGCKDKHWIVGNGNWNIGIGTDYPDAAVGAGVTAKLSVGIVSAYQLYGDGSNLSGVGFSQDADGNLIAGDAAGTGLGVCGTPACLNILLGCGSGNCLVGGCYNIALGLWALRGYAIYEADNTGSDNIALGRSAGCCITSGSDNIMIGNNVAATGPRVTGDCNVLIGRMAGYGVTSASSNIFMGSYAGRCVTSGCYNIAFGKDALQGSSTAADNTGDYNVGIGYSAGFSITSGGSNVLIGRNAGDALTTGTDAIAIGCNALSSEDTNAHGSIAIGKAALQNQNTVTLGNIAIGNEAGKSLTTGGENTFLGYNAGKGVTGSSNVSIGTLTLTASTSGTTNTVVGHDAARNNTGSQNTIIGAAAGDASGDGSGNTFIGKSSGGAVTNGDNNTFLGKYSGDAVTTGCCNVAIGLGANVPDTTGSNQLAIGICADNWIVGNANMNVGIGTTNPDTAVGVGNTAKLSVGILSAYQLYGDGSNLTGTGGETLISGITVQEESSTVGTAGSITILDFQGATVTASASGSNKAVITLAGAGATDAWTQDSQANLVAGTGAGASRDSDTLGNIAIGSSSAALLNAGDYNVSIGTSAGVNMTSGLSNVVIGHCAAYHSSGSSHRNIYMGQEAGKCKQGGGSNIGLGLYALYGSSTPGNNTSSGNIALGECAGKANTSGSYNLLFGRSAGENTTTGSCNVIIGSFAAGSGTITSQHNVIFGKEAAKNITSGGDNFIGGYRAVGSGTLTGSYNAIFGREAGCSLTSGGDNFIAGRRAACGATSAHNSIIIGYLAASGATLTGNQNILMGTSVAKNLIGAYNVMFGLHSGCQLSDASHNVFVGHYTAKNNTGNMCYSVAIGHKTDLPITAGNTQLAIGCNGSYWINGDSSFNVGIGITNPTTKLQVNGTVKATDVDTTSDIRLKTNIKPIDDPLAKVIKIEGVSFNWKEDNRPALGVIADQVEKIIPELVRGDDPKSVNYNGLIGLLIEAVKEQQTEIEALKDRISKLE